VELREVLVLEQGSLERTHAHVAALCGVVLGCLQIIQLGLIARKWFELFSKYQKKFLVSLCVLVIANFPFVSSLGPLERTPIEPRGPSSLSNSHSISLLLVWILFGLHTNTVLGGSYVVERGLERAVDRLGSS